MCQELAWPSDTSSLRIQTCGLPVKCVSLYSTKCKIPSMHMHTESNFKLCQIMAISNTGTFLPKSTEASCNLGNADLHFDRKNLGLICDASSNFICGLFGVEQVAHSGFNRAFLLKTTAHCCWKWHRWEWWECTTSCGLHNQNNELNDAKTLRESNGLSQFSFYWF